MEEGERHHLERKIYYLDGNNPELMW